MRVAVKFIQYKITFVSANVQKDSEYLWVNCMRPFIKVGLKNIKNLRKRIKIQSDLYTLATRINI